jgi:acyl CoA:acetate/3-ketoacid CoA transferase
MTHGTPTAVYKATSQNFVHASRVAAAVLCMQYRELMCRCPEVLTACIIVYLEIFAAPKDHPGNTHNNKISLGRFHAQAPRRTLAH